MLRRLKERGLHKPVVVVTAHGDVSTAVQAMKAGAVDFVQKPFDDGALLATIGAALATVDAPRATSGSEQASARLAALSPREREALNLLMLGKPNKEVARDLGLNPCTIEVHRARLLMRFGVISLAEAERLAVQAQLGPPRDGNRIEEYS